LAFTTTTGASGSDFVGTAAVDSIFALNVAGTVSVEGLAGNDIIDVSNSTGTIGTVTVKGGAGNDTISFDGAGGTTESVISSGSVNGGAGRDNITLVGATSSKARGNEDADNFTLSGNYSSSTINGNSGVDSFGVAVTAANTSTLTLQSTKIHGGADNDGVMNFTNGNIAGAGNDIVSAIDSTINGNLGVDNITIGNVGTASGFEVRGGQGNDTINITNQGADGILYAGDLGDDSISVTAGDADASILGGDGIDAINTTGSTGDHTIDGGIGNDIVTLAAGDDLVTLGEGNDAITAGTGDDSITGGAGADVATITANVGAGDLDLYTITSLTDSAATLTGGTNGFDGFTSGLGLFNDGAGNVDVAGDTPVATTFVTNNLVDISDVSNSLLGDRVSGTTTFRNNAAAGATAAVNVSTFAALRTALAGQLVASGTVANQIEANTVTVASAAVTNINGTYVIINNTNTGLDSGDLMFELNVTAYTADADDLAAEALLAASLLYAPANANTVNGIEIFG
jgi:hypothetical protein